MARHKTQTRKDFRRSHKQLPRKDWGPRNHFSRKEYHAGEGRFSAHFRSRSQPRNVGIQKITKPRKKKICEQTRRPGGTWNLPVRNPPLQCKASPAIVHICMAPNRSVAGRCASPSDWPTALLAFLGSCSSRHPTSEL